MSTAEPKISIIVPVFNTQEYLPQCLGSLLSQTIDETEIVCVDNGSTDGSLKILRDYARKDERIVVLSHPHGRQGDARNAGLAVAKGEYVGFVDSDDYCEADMFSTLHRRAEETRADVAICNIQCFREGEEGSWVMIDPATLREGQAFRVSERPSLFRNFTICNRIFRRDFINEHSLQFPEGLWHEDQFFVGKALFAAERIVTVSDCLYNYRKGHEGSVGVHDGERNLDIFAVMALLFDDVTASQGSNVTELAQEMRVVRYLTLYPSCGSQVRRAYYERMKGEFRDMALPASAKLLKRSEMTELRVVSGRGGYSGYTFFLRLRRFYGVIRRAMRAAT